MLIFSLLMILVSYILGSIPPAYLIGRIFYRVDIRTQGSGNVGGANAGRLFGYHVMVIVALYDILKGTISIILTRLVAENNLATTGVFAEVDNIVALSGFFVILGHCYSVWLNFSGGKGGATTAGVVLALSPLGFVVLLVFWGLIVGFTRFTSLGNLLGVLILPIVFLIQPGETAYLVLGIALVFLIYWKHRENVGRLLRGEERKLGTREKIVTEES